MNLNLKNSLPKLLQAALIVVITFNFTMESDAGTRFSNRKSKTYGHARAHGLDGGGSTQASGTKRKGLFSRFSSKKKPNPTAKVTAPAPTRIAQKSAPAPKKEKKPGLLARLFGKKDSNSTSRTSRPARAPKKSAAPASSVEINHSVLAKADRSSSRVIVDISRQRAYLLVNGQVAVNSPVSTARPGKYTPRGTFTISQRVPSGKVSTIYGVVMPYWMRLGSSAYGMHAGYLPGYPASAGCIRLPSDGAQAIFSHTGYGTRVSIYSSWND